jgi:signal transduction histidine kinase
MRPHGPAIPICVTSPSDEVKRLEEAARESERQYHDIQMQLAHANRVATMGYLSASIAHELNQPLSGVVVSAETALLWLQGDQPNIPEAQKALTRIVRDGNRASEVFRRIRTLIKKAPPQKDSLDINELILEIIGLTQGEAAKNRVQILTRLEDGLPRIEGDRVQLQQVTLNLIMNALEAIGDRDAGPREILVSTAAIPSGNVHVRVQDSGPGIDPAHLERIFDAFYTTKANGLGLGLSICRSIIEAHGGKLWATTGVRHGASFQFRVPAVG